MKKHIPNTITLANLLAGCIGIVYVFNDNLYYAAYAIWLAAIFDFFDGFSARLLKVSSPIGKELDSLADMVTFGALPSFILYKMAIGAPSVISYLTFSLALFSALRLAKFNVDSRQAESFIGMPTPAAAFFVSGLPFWLAEYPSLGNWPVIVTIAILLSLLLIAPLKMLALKFTNYRLADNIFRYLIIVVALIALILLKAKSFPVTITFYLIISLISPKPKQQ